MISKTYIADSIEDILKQAHNDLGEVVYIVQQEQIREKKGLFRKKLRQKAIVATFEDEDINQIKEKAITEYEKINIPTIKEDSFKTEEILAEQSTHMNELKKALRNMSLKMDSLDTKKLYSKPIQELEQILKKQDTDADTISKLIRDITMNLTTEEQNDTDTVIRYAKRHIESLCSNVKSITATPAMKKLTMFVGTTGVGKTSTVSKLATILKSSEGNHMNPNPVGVITLDVFREGAIEQLTNLCNYTQIEVEVANSRETFKNALEKFKDKKYIFIDTTGRSQHNVADIRKVQDILGEYMNMIDEVYLVMSATTKYRDMLDIYNSFKWMNTNRVVFSKLDETSKVGNILSFVEANPSVSLSYLTTGQRVPTDIELVRPNKISELLLNQSTINQLI